MADSGAGHPAPAGDVPHLVAVVAPAAVGAASAAAAGRIVDGIESHWTPVGVPRVIIVVGTAAPPANGTPRPIPPAAVVPVPIAPFPVAAVPVAVSPAHVPVSPIHSVPVIPLVPFAALAAVVPLLAAVVPGARTMMALVRAVFHFALVEYRT